MACIWYLAPRAVNPAPTPPNPRHPLQQAFENGVVSAGCGKPDIEWHDASGAAALPALPAGVQVIVASSTLVVDKLVFLAAAAAIPKVFVGVADPTLLDPSDVTGVNSLSRADSVRLRAHLREAFPGAGPGTTALNRIGVLFNNANPSKHVQAAAILTSAPPAVTLFPVAGLAPGGLPPNFQNQLVQIANGTHLLSAGIACDGLIVLSDPGTLENAAAIVDAVNTMPAPRLKTIYEGREFALVDGLMGFGADRAAAYKKAGELACQICSLPPGAPLPRRRLPTVSGNVSINRATATAEWGAGRHPVTLGGRPTELV